MMFTIEQARALLNAANVFFEDDDMEGFEQVLNMNDVWGWACADAQAVPDDKLIEVAELFWRYGWCGILYWVIQQGEWGPSEFLDNNRFIDFVRHEEKLRKEVPDSSTRAYKKLVYTLGKT